MKKPLRLTSGLHTMTQSLKEQIKIPLLPMTYVDAVSYLEKNGFDEPDPADYGVWVPGIPVLVGNGTGICRNVPTGSPA